MKKSTQMGLSLGANIVTILVMCMGGAILAANKIPQYDIWFIIGGMVLSFALIAMLLVKFIKLADAEAKGKINNEK